MLFVAVLVLTAGCSKGPAFRLGRDAEKRGDAHLAYAYYCQAAVRRPDNRELSASIKRLSPAAASYWRQHARAAASVGQYADAWRMAMRCLRIQPDDMDALALVRELESNHAMAVASAREVYERGGPGTLVVAPLAAVPASAMEPPGSDLPDAGPEAGAVMASALAGVGRGAGAASVTGSLTPADRTEAGEGANENAGGTYGESTEGARPPLDRAGSIQPPAGGRRTGGTIAITLSRRDKRYERRVFAGDGFSVRLRDTDDAPDADLDIYAGDKRIRKIRDIEPGQSETFTTPSGAAYSLSLLSVDHATRTVHIALKPA